MKKQRNRQPGEQPAPPAQDRYLVVRSLLLKNEWCDFKTRDGFPFLDDAIAFAQQFLDEGWNPRRVTVLGPDRKAVWRQANNGETAEFRPGRPGELTTATVEAQRRTIEPQKQQTAPLPSPGSEAYAAAKDREFKSTTVPVPPGTPQRLPEGPKGSPIMFDASGRRYTLDFDGSVKYLSTSSTQDGVRHGKVIHRRKGGNKNTNERSTPFQVWAQKEGITRKYRVRCALEDAVVKASLRERGLEMRRSAVVSASTEREAAREACILYGWAAVKVRELTPRYDRNGDLLPSRPWSFYDAQAHCLGTQELRRRLPGGKYGPAKPFVPLDPPESSFSIELLEKWEAEHPEPAPAALPASPSSSSIGSSMSIEEWDHLKARFLAETRSLPCTTTPEQIPLDLSLPLEEIEDPKQDQQDQDRVPIVLEAAS